MLSESNEYGRNVNTFSPEGRIYQIEYAIEAIKLGSTAIGIKTTQGVVLAAERRLPSPLMIPSSLEKVMQIDDHVGCVLSGLVADARTLVDHSRVESQNHRFTYDEPMTIKSIAQGTSDMAINFGEGDGSKQKPMARPYGVSLLIAGVDEYGPALYQTDPSGNFMDWKARAIGPASEGAQSYLEEKYHSTMSIRDAEELALQTLKTVMEEKINKDNVELCNVKTEVGKFETKDSAYIAEIITTLSQYLF